MPLDDAEAIAALVRRQRQAALGTLQQGSPFVSMVAFVAEPAGAGLLMHLSLLAPHTRQLQSDPRAALLISEPDDGRDDIQTLGRLSLTGSVQGIARESSPYAAAQQCYLQRFPAATQ